MGKYMKKSKITGDVAVMELSQSTTGGVRTRAKTHALQRLHSPSSPNPDSSPFSYLQLRSRRLEKPPLLQETNNSNLLEEAEQNPDAISHKKLNFKVSSKMGTSSDFSTKGEMVALSYEAEDLGVEVSFGENCLDFESRERSTRESTPCSLIRGSDTIGTPGSTTRQANRQVRTNILRNIPTPQEVEEFFTCAEQEQQRLFIEKYNFDVVNDLPLLGRYEWVQVTP